MKTVEMRMTPKDYEGVHTSRGNQLKWQQDGYWYKADQFGYEGVAETVVSLFLKVVKKKTIRDAEAEIFMKRIRNSPAMN